MLSVAKLYSLMSADFGFIFWCQLYALQVLNVLSTLLPRILFWDMVAVSQGNQIPLF